MEDQDSILLDQFFSGMLDASEQDAVLRRAESDPEFGREFDLRRRMEEWPAREAGRRALSGQLQDLGNEFFSADTAAPPLRAVVNRRRWWSAAAAVLVLLVGAVWFFGRPQADPYSRYAQVEPLSLTERGTAQSDATLAEEAFNAGRYAEAFAALDRLSAAAPGNTTAILYKGICLLQLNRSAEARSVLAPLANGNSALKADAIWYTALSFLKENNRPAGRTELSRLAPGMAHYDQAQALMREIE